MRSAAEENSINRVLKARGLPSLGEPGVVEALAFLVEDHRHFMELLRACEPGLRRDMYEAMSPHLRFTAYPLEVYVIEAKERAAQLPTVDATGELHAPTVPVLESPEVELWVKCARCGKESIFCESDEHAGKRAARLAGWTLDAATDGDQHVCPNCEDALALDEKTGQKAPE
jgi:hypothetical protein